MKLKNNLLKNFTPDLDDALLNTHRTMYGLGILFEPAWGIYVKNYSPEMGIHEDLRARFGLSIFLLTLFLIAHFKIEFYKQNYRWMTILLIISYVGQRYFLLSLFPTGINQVIDLYTLCIFSVLVSPSVADLFWIIPLLTFPSIYFPQNNYLVLSNLVTALPLTAMFKYAALRYQEKLQEAQKKIKDQSLIHGAKNLLSTISHDVNNHLHKMTLMNQIAKDSGASNAEIRNTMHQNLQSEIEKIARIITSLKEMVTEETPTPNFNNFETIFNELKILNDDKLNDYKIKLDLSSDFVYLFCDSKELKKIIQPIIKNAIDELKNYPIDTDKRITIKCQETDSHNIILISNSGKKILPEIQEKMFEPFFSTKEKGLSFGLGLSMAKELAEKYSYSLTFDNTYPFTTFCLKIPKVAQENHPLSREAA